MRTHRFPGFASLIFGTLAILFSAGPIWSQPQTETASGRDPWQDLRSIFYSGQLERAHPSIIIATTTPDQVTVMPNVDASSSVEMPPREIPDFDPPPIGADPPQVPATPPPPERSLPRLQGIVITSDSEKSVIINGMILGEGDFVDGYTIARIRKNSVLLKRQREEHVLYVKP